MRPTSEPTASVFRAGCLWGSSSINREKSSTTMRLQTMLFHSAAALVLSLLVTSAALAQGGGEKFSFDDIPVDDARQYYVAVGGGYLGMLSFMNFDELNKVSGSLGLPGYSGQLYLNGGGGVISLL